MSKCYQPPNINLISKDLLGVVHDQIMERNPSLIEKESDIFGLLFLVDGATISRVPLLNIFVSGKNLFVAVLELFDCQGNLADGGKRMEPLYVIDFLRILEELILTSQVQMLSCLMELKMFNLLVNC